jgi:LysM repeat protein
MTDALINLAAAIKASASTPIDVTSAFLTGGMQDPAVVVPQGLDAALAKAFGTPAGSGLTVTIAAANVGPVVDDKFTVTSVTLTLLSQPIDAAATLTFALTGAAGAQVLSVTIATPAKGWSWTWLSPGAAGAPYSLFSVDEVVLTFATSGATASAVQAFAARLVPPAQLKPVVEVVQGLLFPNVLLNLAGAMDFTKVDGVSVLLPVTDLSAVFSGSGLKLGYLDVTRPAFGLSISEAYEADDGGDDAELEDDPEDAAATAIVAIGDDPPLMDQQSASYFSIDLTLTPEIGPSASYQLRASVDPRLNDGLFTFVLAATANDALFTPATAIALIDNKGSFFSGTPAPLQQFLGSIGLRAMTFEGAYKNSLRFTSVALVIGADTRQMPFTLLEDPSNPELTFKINDFELNWQAQFGGQKASFSYLFRTEFVLLPTVFTTRSGDPYGIFDVTINSNYQIGATFGGQAKMSTLFQKVAGITLPSQFEVTISNISVTLDIPNKRYTFNAGIDVALGFPSASDPLISLSDAQLNLVASTPRPKDDGGAVGAAGSTNYAGSFMGQLQIGPVYVTASVIYVNPAVDGGTGSPFWQLHAALARPIDIRAVISQYFSPGQSFELPSDLFSIDLKIKALVFDATIPASGKTSNGTAGAVVALAADETALNYTIAATFAWSFTLGPAANPLFMISSPKTALTIAYDGSKPDGSRYSGSVSAITSFSFLNSDVELDFVFAKDKDEKWDNTLAVTWEGITATYKSKDSTLTFTLKGWSLGLLVQRLVRTLGDPYFTIDSPWDLLNKIPLDGMFVTLNLDAKPNEPTITAGYALASPLDLGFIKIKGLQFARKPDDKGVTKITLALDAEIPGPFQAVIDNSGPEQKQAWNNLIGSSNSSADAPKAGQPVDKLPSVPGRGNSYFNMPILVLGQRVAIAGYAGFKDTYAVLQALSDSKTTPSTTGGANPVSPKSGGGSPMGTPYYEAKNNWTVASHLQFLKAGGDWTVDLMFVFNDPNLYGLRLALAGEKAKALGNLVIDIIYKKITDDVGLYQIEFTFPDSIRNLNFGQVSIVLPQLGVMIYTNGDFVIDVGFPYNMDFQRSFSISTIIFVGPIPIPLLGAGGFYFGKLSSATATQTPATTKGTFDPVIIFGFGLQIGIGYNFIKGPLKAGFAITVFGIIEGVIAAWHPYDETSTGGGRAVQDNYYFKISGTVGIIGLLYGEINFAIISASLQIRLTLSVTLTYECYRPIPILVRATVDVSLKVKIDLGLFSISISLSFHMDVSTQFVIPAPNPNAPWDSVPAQAPLRIAANERAIRRAAGALAVAKQVARTAAKPKLTLLASPAATVMADEGATNVGAARGAFVFLLAMDAPASTDPTASDTSSFHLLLQDFLPWLIDALKGGTAESVNLASAADESVTEAELEAAIDRLADLAQPPIPFSGFLQFLSSFDVDIAIPSDANKDKLEKDFASSVLFPVFDGLSISAQAQGQPPLDVDFETYVTANETYRANIAKLFEALTAKVTAPPDQPQPRATARASDPVSMASFVFVDAFNLIGRQLLQAGQTAMRDYAYPLANGNSMEALFKFLKAHRVPDAMPNSVRLTSDSALLSDLVQANLATPLAPGQTLNLTGLIHVIQSRETLDDIASTFAGTTGASAKTLIVENPQVQCLAPGVEVKVGAGTTTGPGATFTTLAASLGYPSASAMADAVGAALGQTPGLLLPGAILNIPVLAYTIQAGDSLGPIADGFNLAAVDLFLPTPDFTTTLPHNWTVKLFDDTTQKTVPAPQLTTLQVSEIWQALLDTGQVPQIAGMLSRFLIYGLRLPSDPNNPDVAGPTLSPAFHYPTNQGSYGLYQLIGQQTPAPDYVAGASYTITLGRADSSHGVDLSFITFNGAQGNAAPPLNLDAVYQTLSYAVTFARNGAFRPAPSFERMAPATRTPKTFSIRSFSRWSAAGVDQVATAIGGPVPAHPDPVLWSLPDALLQAMGQRQAALARRFDGAPASIYAFLPAYQPQLTTNDPASGAAKTAPIASYAWATRVDLAIRKLPPSPNPAGNPGLSGVTYEVLGPSPSDALLLERMLSAMDTLGRNLISDLFLLYPDAGAGNARLASAAKRDFIAYLTQTNLSTETNPPAAFAVEALLEEQTAPQGILNPKDSFVKLLWELSTVRSGGYFLTYADLVSGGGLPDAIFDDNGSATLTLVVSLATGAILGRLTNFINAFITLGVTPQQGTAVSVVGLPTVSAGQRPAAIVLSTDSLDSLSAAYGVGIGPIAEVNADFPVPKGLILPVRGIVHLVTPEDAAAGGSDAIYQALATLYSQDSAPNQEITAGQIKQENNNVTAAAGVALFIPTVHYLTPDAGRTLAGVAARFGVSVDQIAVSVAATPGLFGNGTSGAAYVTIDSLTYDLQNNSGLGNVGFEINRVAKPEPVQPPLPAGLTQAQADAAQAFLYELYHVVAAGLQPNAAFTANDMALPFGPQNHDEPADADSMRDPRRRSMALQAMQATDEFVYRNTLNIAANARFNPVIAHARAGSLPAAEGNPYIGVGSIAQLALQWRDVFGNTIVTPWVTPPRDYAGALNYQPAPVLYSDRLIGLAAWPNLQATYDYSPSGTSPLLNITLSLSASAYQSSQGSAASGDQDVPDWQRRAIDDLNSYVAIWWQLVQNYAKLDLPWCNGPAVTATLDNSLVTPGSDLPTKAPLLQTLTEYVENAIAYLAQRARGQTPPAPPPSPITQAIPYATLSSDNVIPLEVSLTLARPTLLVEPTVAGLVNGHTVTSAILPMADKDSKAGQSGYTTFAEHFEAAFVSANGWKMRVGSGLAEPDDSVNGRSQVLWAVRFQDSAPGVTGAGITYHVQTNPGFYAPKPLARTLTSGTVTIKTKFVAEGAPGATSHLGGDQTVSLTGVDLNAMFESSLKAVDSFLLPTYVTPAFLLQAAPAIDPLTEGPLGAILKCKERLANAIAATALPVLSTSPDDRSTLVASQEKLRQALLNQLAPAYSVSAVVTFGVADAGGAPVGPAGPATLYGQPSVDPGGGVKGEKTYSMSTARISLGDETPADLTLAGRGSDLASPLPVEPRLSFLFNSKNVADASYVGLPLQFPISHMEHDRAHVPGIKGYTQSNWIAFITGPINQRLNDGDPVDIPVVLRALPEPPTMQGQSSDATNPNPTNPGQLAEWDYAFDYIYRRAAQDTALISVSFNLASAMDPGSSAPDLALMAQLAQFTTIYPAIEAVFDGTLAKLTVADGADPASPNAALAKAAVAGFSELLGDLTAAFENWVWPNSAAALLADPAPVPKVICTFELLLEGDPSSTNPGETPAQSEILNLTVELNGKAYVPDYDPVSHMLIVRDPVNPQTVLGSLPAPQIEIPAAKANWLSRQECYSKSALYGFDYTVAGPPTSKLNYAAALAISARKVRFQSLNLFVYQDAWASISITRNKYLVPSEAEEDAVATNSEFVFASPVVRFADPAIPALSVGDFQLSNLTPTVPPGPVTAGYLNAFFAQATAGGLGAPIEVAMEARYSYRLADNPGLPRSVLPVVYLPPAPGVASGDGAPEPVLALAAFVDHWRAETGVTTGGAAQITFTLDVFNAQQGTSSKQPILRVANMVLDAANAPVK